MGKSSFSFPYSHYYSTLVTEQKLEYYNEKLMKELKDPNIDIKINYWNNL